MHPSLKYWGEDAGENFRLFVILTFQVQAFLLAALSPYLASLLSQVISVPALHVDLHPGRQLPLHLLALLLLPDVLPHHLPGLHWASLWGGGEATCHSSWHPDSNMER